MEITESIIQKFFDYTGTAEEAAAVSIYFASNPTQLEKYFEEEWAEINEESLSSKEFEELRQNILRQLYPKRNPLRWIQVAVAVAASILLVITATWLLTFQKKVPANTYTRTVTNLNLKRTVQMNTTGKEMKIVLEDGSLVRLMPGAVLKYYLSFKGLQARDIYLLGEAYFKVAKDKTKPFTVYAGGIATTAVGTQFTVKENKDIILVKLYKGKVSIKGIAGKVKRSYNNRLYLLPGQEFVYNQTTGTFEVKAFTVDEVLPDKKYRREEPLSRGSDNLLTLSGNWYLFNNQSMTQVFDQLEEMYNVKIVYESREMRNVYFIGKFEKTDSVESILKNIALLKKLKLEKRGNVYFLKR